MSHFDKLVRLPEGFVVVAKTANSEFAGIAHQTKPIFGECSSPSPSFKYTPIRPLYLMLFCPSTSFFRRLHLLSLVLCIPTAVQDHQLCTYRLTWNTNRCAISPRAWTRMYISQILSFSPFVTWLTNTSNRLPVEVSSCATSASTFVERSPTG